MSVTVRDADTNAVRFAVSIGPRAIYVQRGSRTFWLWRLDE